MQFEAIRVYQTGSKVSARLEKVDLDSLGAGEVVIQSHYSSLNYKDALAITGQGKILRSFPLIAGIDVSGKVLSSADSRFKEGDSVIVTGCGLGENQDGGFSEIVRVPADWVVHLPSSLTLQEAMIYGTAGFTSALSIHRLEQNGLSPDKGEVLVTGASGGVGSFAVSQLAHLGYKVVAVSGKKEAQDYLLELGASRVLRPEELKLGSRPLESATWAGAIDNVGGKLLSQLLAHIQLWGNVASVGLAGGAEINATVMPFILRGVSLLGISSANCPMPLRRKLWERLASDLKPAQLHAIVNQEITLSEIEPVAQNMLQRQTLGRYIVAIKTKGK